MTCPHCAKQLPEGIAVCFGCGKPLTAAPPQPIPPPPIPPQQIPPQPIPPQPRPDWPQYGAPPSFEGPAAPSREAPEKPPGLKPFVPEPLTNRRVRPSARGTGYAGLLGFIAWLAAVTGPALAVSRAVDGLDALVRGVIDGTVAEITRLLEALDLSADAFEGIGGIWDLISGLPGFLAGIIGGFALLGVALITLFFLLPALRNNHTAAKILIFVNLALCLSGDWLCYRVIDGLEKLGAIPPPYDGASMFILGSMAIAAVFWAGAAALYFHKTN